MMHRVDAVTERWHRRCLIEFLDERNLLPGMSVDRTHLVLADAERVLTHELEDLAQSVLDAEFVALQYEVVFARMLLIEALRAKLNQPFA